MPKLYKIGDRVKLSDSMVRTLANHEDCSKVVGTVASEKRYGGSGGVQICEIAWDPPWHETQPTKVAAPNLDRTSR